MGLLKQLFDAISYLPLIGPDDVYEAELLLHGVKPIGLFVDVIQPPDIIEDYSPSMEKVRNDITNLDIAVSNGILSKQQFTFQGQLEGGFSVWNLYCQKGIEQDMAELSELLLANLEKREPRFFIPKDYGEYFGYSNADISLFAKGGYDSLPFIIKDILKSTHGLRVKCRVSKKLGKRYSELIA
ncbi:MAG: hypothetical protein GY797_25830 [Deltaproteobacteria bacterium]|nr:hypothetical protein [Deltaproteobacteria bacterium]